MTSDVIRGFDRDTACLATGVLGATIFAALVLAVQEHHPTKVKPTEEVAQAGSGRLPNANVIPEGRVVAKSSNDKMGSGQGNGVDHEFTKTSLQHDPSSQREPTLTAPIPVLAFAPEINPSDTRNNLGSGTLVHRQRLLGGERTKGSQWRKPVVSCFWLCLCKKAADRTLEAKWRGTKNLGIGRHFQN